jgi:hypothetical protein
LEEIAEEDFDGSLPKLKAIRSANYMKTNYLHLVKVREAVSFDAMADNDQNGKKYWQIIKYKFHRGIPNPST